jgi:hypothetical protein
MTSVLVMLIEISVAMAIGFVLGRIWQTRCHLEEQRALFLRESHYWYAHH